MSEIKFIKGNIFTSKHQTLVNTVNCVGIMGAGIALEFKYRYPEMFEKYAKYCEDKLIQIGKLWVYEVPNANQKVLNFPTKQHWKYPSKYEYLEKGLNKFVETYKDKGITSIAFPMLGALNGGLDPDRVIDLMQQYLSSCDIPIEVYEYDGQAYDDLIDKFRNAFIYDSLKELEKATGLKPNTLKKVKSVLENQDFNSLIQLDKVKGIGEETVKACYQFAMKLKTKPKAQQAIAQDIFSIAEPQKQEITEKPKPNKVNGTKTEFDLSEKVTLTGLDVQTIEKIESKEEEVSIKAIKAYCQALKLNFAEFVAKNYATI
jgi:O-acetyl-ADP-ribose deacetylase (regulator of RNase III)/transcriptional regulator with XRE-family HTH domain